MYIYRKHFSKQFLPVPIKENKVYMGVYVILKS